MRSSLYSLLLITPLFFSACKKDPSKAAGDGGWVYETEDYQDIMDNYSVFVNTAELKISNADPYNEIIGQVISNAKETKINGNGTEISNIEISDIRLTEIELYSGYDIDIIENFLQDASFSLDYTGSSGTESIVLATFNQVNTSTKKVEFSINQIDLTSVMENNPQNLRFNLSFNGEPSQARVTYRLFFTYNWSYDERERK